VRLPTGDRVLYTYDAFARRVRKDVVPAARRDRAAVVRLALTVGPGAVPKIRTTRYWWDGDVLAGEVDSELGTRVHVHEPGTFVPMLQAEQGEVFAVVTDHLGMPKELVDQDGRVAWAAAHSAWGQVVEVWRDPASGRGKRVREVESPFRLLGQYAEIETGLCYTRHRWFDFGTGRWLSPDPLGVIGGRNLFAFDGNPINRVDPTGLACPYTDLTDARARRHILEGDATGGGHRPGTGIPGKSEFPIGWSDDRIIHELSDVATDPSSRSTPGHGGRIIVEGTRSGIAIRVIIESPARGGRIVTGFPTNVARNPHP